MGQTDFPAYSVPTLVPKPGSPTVTQGNLPESEFTALRALELPWVTSGHEICSLKIRVSVVRWTRAIHGARPTGDVTSYHWPLVRQSGITTGRCWHQMPSQCAE